MHRGAVGRAHDGQPKSDGAVELLKSHAYCSGAGTAALIIGALEAIRATALGDRQGHDVAVRLELPAKGAERLRLGSDWHDDVACDDE